MTDIENTGNKAQKWAAFYRAEESLYDFVTNHVTVVQEFGPHCHPSIKTVFDEKGNLTSIRPKHVRWIGSVDGNNELMHNIRTLTEEVRRLYLAANPKAARYPREIIFLQDCWKLVVNENPAFSALIVKNHKQMVLASECVNAGHYEDQIQNYSDLKIALRNIGLETAQVNLNTATISLTIESHEIIKYYGRDDLVYRVPSGIQYRMRINEGTNSFQSKLGFVICSNAPVVGTASSYRKGRDDRYLIASEPLPFPFDIKGQFWIKK